MNGPGHAPDDAPSSVRGSSWKLPAPRAAAWFAARAMLLFTLLTLPSATVVKTYGRWLTDGGNVLLGWSGLGEELLLRKKRGSVIRLLFADEDGTPHFAFPIDSYWTGFVPLAAAVALALAWRQSLGARLATAILAGVLVHAYVFLRVALMALHAWTLHDATCARAHAMVFEATWWKATLPELVEVLHVQPTSYLLAPVASWLLARFTLAQLARRIARAKTSAPS